MHTSFSGVALNDIDYLMERETGFEPFSLTNNPLYFNELPFHFSDCRHFAESIVLTVACRCALRKPLVFK
jgi:hypothetical protein